jgi:hypothetical protein
MVGPLRINDLAKSCVRESGRGAGRADASQAIASPFVSDKGNGRIDSCGSPMTVTLPALAVLACAGIELHAVPFGTGSGLPKAPRARRRERRGRAEHADVVAIDAHQVVSLLAAAIDAQPGLVGDRPRVIRPGSPGRRRCRAAIAPRRGADPAQRPSSRPRCNGTGLAQRGCMSWVDRSGPCRGSLASQCRRNECSSLGRDACSRVGPASTSEIRTSAGRSAGRTGGAHARA